MVRPNIDPFGYNKRFSDRIVFWIIFLIAGLSANIVVGANIYYLWGASGLFYIWCGLNFAAIFVSVLSKLCRAYRSSRSWRYWGNSAAVWNIFILISAFLIFIQEGLARIGFPPLSLSARLGVAFTLSFLICLYGLREAFTIRSVVLDIKTDRLPDAVNCLRIVQISDLHLGTFVSPKHLRRILNAVEDEEPDMLVVTGDIVDGDMSCCHEEAALFRDLACPFGVWSVPGNHDYYDNIENAVDFMQQAGMHVLRTSVAEVGGIVLVGMDDPDHLVRGEDGRSRSQKLLESLTVLQREKYVIVLRHRPVVERATTGIFQLQLSGHTHGGQLFPLLSSRHKLAGHSRGALRLKDGASLYVNNGAGFVGPPLRFFAPPEITVINLLRSAGKENKEMKKRGKASGP